MHLTYTVLLVKFKNEKCHPFLLGLFMALHNVNITVSVSKQRHELLQSVS